MTESQFLGEPFSYWIELKRRIDLDPKSFETENLLKELVTANAKVRYYELQIDRMNQYRIAAEK